MRLFREDRMSLDRRLEILAENGAEAGLDVAPQCLADFRLLAGHSELHGSHYLFGRLDCPTTDVGTPRCAVKQRAIFENSIPRLILAFLIAQISIIFSRRRCTEEGILIASRYFATVRRAISTPSIRNNSTILSSESVSSAGSAPIKLRMRCRTASAECDPLPLAAGIDELKKYFSS